MRDSRTGQETRKDNNLDGNNRLVCANMCRGSIFSVWDFSSRFRAKIVGQTTSSSSFFSSDTMTKRLNELLETQKLDEL